MITSNGGQDRCLWDTFLGKSSPNKHNRHSYSQREVAQRSGNPALRG